MKKTTILLAFAATFSLSLAARADITSADWWPSDISQFTCSSNGFSGGVLWMNGTQLQPTTTIAGNIYLNSPGDPTLTLANSINNDSGNLWIGYQVGVVMSIPFTFVNLPPTVSNPPNNDWFVASVNPPTLQASGPYAGQYEGTLQFSEGTPVSIGGELDWQYSINFAGSSQNSFTEVLMPVTQPIPEPGALAMAGLGGLLLAAQILRQARKVS